MESNGLKQKWMDAAEVVDAWRVFPRGFMVLFWYFLWDVHSWYKLAETTSDIYANLVFGSIAALTGFYMGSGRKWE
jgi:hypothetical protein